MADDYNILDTPVSGGRNWPYLNSSNKNLLPLQFSMYVSKTCGADIGIIYPFEVPLNVTIDAFLVNVTGAVGASKGRAALFNVNTSGQPGTIIVQSGDIDTTTTGAKALTFTAQSLAAGFYYMGLVANAAITFQGAYSSFYGANPTLIGCSNSIFAFGRFESILAGGWSAWGDTPTISDTKSVSNADTILAGLRCT